MKMTFFKPFLLIFTHSDPEAQPRGGFKADFSETFRSTVRGCGGRVPTTHPQGRISGLPKGSPVNGHESFVHESISN